MTSWNPIPEYGRRPAARRGPVALVVAVTVLVTISAVLAVRHDTGAGTVSVLGLVLSGAAVVGVCLVLVATHHSGRAAREQALQNLGVARRAEAVAADLRNEVLRLQSDLARLAARVETSHRQRAKESTDDDRPRPRTGS